MNNYVTFLLFYLLCFSVSAADVTVNLNGGILTQSCNISSQDLIKNINFPDLNPSDFSQAGATSAEQPVSIFLENCTGKVNNVAYEFSGDADAADSTLLKITGKSVSENTPLATGLAIEILDRDKKKVALNTKKALNEIITGATYSLDFYFRYKAVSNNVSSGDASAVVYLDIYYE